MRREKLIVSFVVMMIVFFVCSMSVFASDTGVQPLTISNTGNSSSNATSIKPINASTNNGTSISGGNAITPITSSNNSNRSTQANTNSSSSTYTTRNSSNNTVTESSSELPYTGVNYSVVFIIIALVISAVYAYKKVSDYNM